MLCLESSSGLEARLPAKLQPPQRIAIGVWILSRLGRLGQVGSGEEQ